MYSLTLAQADALIEAAIGEATRLSLKPLTIGVFDPAGNLISLERQENAPRMGPKVVTGKANGALALGASSRTVGELTLARPHVLGAIGSLNKGGMVPAAGALIVKDAQDTIIGAIAASGDTSDNDELAVLGAIEALGFATIR